MTFINVICIKFLYLHVKPPETFKVNKTDGTHEIMFQKEIEMNWQKEWKTVYRENLLDVVDTSTFVCKFDPLHDPLWDVVGCSCSEWVSRSNI